MRIFAFIICLAYCFGSYAQDASKKRLLKIDSLKTALETENKDTSKVKLLNSLSFNYKNIGDFDNALLSANQALTLTKKTIFKKGEARALYNLAAVYRAKGDYTSALEYNTKCLEIREALNDKKNIATVLSEIGTVYRLKGDYNKSIDFQTKALKIREEFGDKLEVAGSLNALASVYNERGEYAKALEINLRSAKLSVEAGETKDVASTYNNIGNIFKSLDNIEKALEYYSIALELNEKSGNLKWKAVNLNNLAGIYIEKKNNNKALECYNQSLEIKEKIGEKSGIANTLMNMGTAYGNMGDQKKAIEFANRALKIREEIGDKHGIAESLQSLGSIYHDNGEYKKAVETLNKGVELCKKIGARYNLQQCYLNLSSSFEKLNDQKNALKYYKLSSEEKDSLLNKETNESMAKMSAQFDSEKKDNEIKLLSKDKEKQEAISLAERKKQNIIITSVTCGLILMLVFVFFVYRGYRQKKKDNVEIIRQKEIIEEKNSEVHASITYAKRIQSAILPSDKLLKETLNNSFIIFKPKDIVSGDFYWLQKVNNKVLFAVVDCTGHGVPGALVSVVGHNALNRTVKEFGLTNPAAILDKLNFLVEETFENSENEVKDGMDISLCCLNLDTNKLEWAGANNPLWIIDAQGLLTEIKGDKQPIGKFIDRKPFTNHSLQLKKNDSIYIFTDGLADQFGGPKGKKFKYKQIKEQLIELNNTSLEQQQEIISRKLTSWKGQLEQVDDICVMGVKV